MTQQKSWLMTVLMSLLCICFLSVPAFAGGGDEDPWDADEGNGGTNGGDIGAGDQGGTTGYLKESNTVIENDGSGFFAGLLMSIVTDLYDYFYDIPENTEITATHVKERSTGVSIMSYRGSDVAR
ncbi:MAG: hypothetical protein P1R58_03955 [bacterium]|nr:hypothetical protein [bacterium]